MGLGAAAMRVVRCLASRFASCGLPMTGNDDTLAMDEPLTPKALRFRRLVETGDSAALSG